MAKKGNAIKAGQAYVELFADDSRMIRGLRQAQRKLRAWGNGIRQLGTQVAAVGLGLTAPFLAAAKVFASMGDQLDKMAIRTGFSVEALSELGFAAEQTFREFSAGECLFLGVSGSKRGSDPWELDFAFAASPNVASLSVGDITGIAKKGWEYLWVRYEEAGDATEKMLIRRPVHAMVEQVYRSGDFSALGI